MKDYCCFNYFNYSFNYYYTIITECSSFLPKPALIATIIGLLLIGISLIIGVIIYLQSTMSPINDGKTTPFKQPNNNSDDNDAHSNRKTTNNRAIRKNTCTTKAPGTTNNNIVDLILIGGGHAHVHVIKMLGMNQRNDKNMNNVRITCICNTMQTPYSGMLPGYIAGHYSYNDIHIDMNQLCQFSNVILIYSSVYRITSDVKKTNNNDISGGYIYCADHRPPIRYDLLSINVGIIPTISFNNYSDNIKNASTCDEWNKNNDSANTNNTTTSSNKNTIIPVKPISHFCNSFNDMISRWNIYYTNNTTRKHMSSSSPLSPSLSKQSRNSSKMSTISHNKSNTKNDANGEMPYTVCIVGGGAGGIELCLSIQHAMQQQLQQKQRQQQDNEPSNNNNAITAPPPPIQMIVITRSKNILESYNRFVQNTFLRILKERNIKLFTLTEVVSVTDDETDIMNDDDDGEEVEFVTAEENDVTNVDKNQTNSNQKSPRRRQGHHHFKLRQQQFILKRLSVRFIEHDHDIFNITSNDSCNHKEDDKIPSDTDSNKHSILVHECFWCTNAVAPSWISQSTPFLCSVVNNCIRVNDTYESISHRGVFAVGDCCHIDQYPRPKAGVFAVRAAPYLYENLLRYILRKDNNQPPLLLHHQPQKHFLSIISTGDQYAVMTRGKLLCIEGSWVWNIKEYIDRKWMDQYTVSKWKNLDTMMMYTASHQGHKMNHKTNNNNNNAISYTRGTSADTRVNGDKMLMMMKCGGCGAKVGSTIVARVLKLLHQRQVDRAKQYQYIGMPQPIDPDDAAIWTVNLENMRTSESDNNSFDLSSSSPKRLSQAHIVQTIDYFSKFISDPYQFGKIAAVHALSDIYAMGAIPQTALTLAVVPYVYSNINIDDRMTESTLLHMLAGVSDVLQDENVQFIGGHTCEGHELACGLSVTGLALSSSSSPSSIRVLRKRGGKVGDKIVLTKPIGTGALFAADMRCKMKGEYVREAIDCMVTSNRSASRVAILFDGVHACTDITGFGLIGHLLEMLIANDNAESDKHNYHSSYSDNQSIGAVLHMKNIQFLQGGIEASKMNVYSTLQHENERSGFTIVENHDESCNQYPIEYPLLFDPQTSGGLVFFVDPDVVDEFILLLHVENKNNSGGMKQSLQGPIIIGEVVRYKVPDSNNDDDDAQENQMAGYGSIHSNLSSFSTSAPSSTNRIRIKL